MRKKEVVGLVIGALKQSDELWESRVALSEIKQEKALDRLRKRIVRLECDHDKLEFEAHKALYGPPYFLVLCSSCGQKILETICKSEWLLAKERYIKTTSEAELEALGTEIRNSEPCKTEI